MLIHEITLKNFLSYGESSPPIILGPLNVIIGSNGSGKSNFLEAIELLRSAPMDFLKPIREGGGTLEWLWKGVKEIPIASVDVVVNNAKGPQSLRYVLSFTATGQRFELIDERIEHEKPHLNNEIPLSYYKFNNGKPLLKPNTKSKSNLPVEMKIFDLEKSILSQRRDPERYPVVTYLADALSSMRLYGEWSFGRDTPPRKPQPTDLPNIHLEKDCSNLGLVLNYLRRTPAVKAKLDDALTKLYDAFDYYEIQLEGGTAQIFFYEKGMRNGISATRLSDGTLRYLCLLAILLHPSPPPLVCIEEPELGLHPDILPTIAELLKDASTRMQLIVTTHSDILVDAMTDMPEAVLVCEKTPKGSQLRRLDPEQLKPWLEEYRLGYLWTRGDIGGNRW